MIDLKLVLDKVDKLLQQKKCIIAFSGGPDSVFLLEILSKYYKDNIKNLIPVYINYHDSEYTFLEENIVNYYLKKHHLTCYQMHIQFDKDKDHNFEDWARKIRYHFFFDICQIEKTNNIVVAHHLDDLIETYILQKRRNSIPKTYGLGDISYMKQYRIIRPLLNIYKKDIISYLKDNKLKYYDDITNYYSYNKRYQIRKENISIKEKETIITEINNANNKIINLYNEFENVSTKNISFYLSLSEDNKKRYLFFYLNKIYQNYNDIAGKAKLIYDFLKRKERGILFLDEKYNFYKLDDMFFISSKFKNINYSFEITKEGLYSNEIFNIDIKDLKTFNIKSFPFKIRKVNKYDQMGTNIITKDIHNFIKKQKIPLYLRDIYPVFENLNGEIFYVPFYCDIINKKIPFSFNIDKDINIAS